MTICGTVVLDICQHFIERWNEIKKRKVMSSMGDTNSLHTYPIVNQVPKGRVCRVPYRLSVFLYLDYSHIDWLAFPHNPQVSPNEAIARTSTPASLLP